MDELTDSFGRCCANSEFLDRFYEVFLKSHPNIAPRFAQTDMAKQKALLRHGLATVVMYAAGRASAETGLKRIGISHAPGGSIDVDRSYYPHWIKSLIATVAEIDPQFSPEVEMAWRKACKLSVNLILSFYEG